MDQKILWDCHMHSSFSADSDTPMEEMIQTAADQGLTGICFTEHFDPDYPDTPENLDFSLNIPAYRQKLENLADDTGAGSRNCGAEGNSLCGEGENTDLSGTAIPAGGTDENGISGAGLPGKLSVF